MATVLQPLSLDLKGKKILVAEDNIINQLIIKKILEKTGCEIIIVENGNLALEELERQNFDLIIMDCQMPDMDGFETTKTLRVNKENTHSEIPVIALTANVTLSDKTKCLESGMNEFLVKPINKNKLYSVLAFYLKAA